MLKADYFKKNNKGVTPLEIDPQEKQFLLN
jgi:hypothetical protein